LRRYPTVDAVVRKTVLQTKRVPDEKLMGRLEAAGVDFGSVAAPRSAVLSKGMMTAGPWTRPLLSST
jgi:hypothetical protein